MPPSRYAPASTTCLLGASLAAALLPAAARAAEADVEMDNEGRPAIVVVGERSGDANPNANTQAPYKVERSADGKFTEKLRDTPRTITAIPKEVLRDTGATSLRDVARATSGVTLATGEGGNAFGDRVFIRGFEARNDVYIDGMRDPGVSSRETFAVEQIEIVKGPSSAFGGRGTTGGLVSLQSKKAELRNFAVAEASIGTDDYRRFTLDANRKLSDTLALRVNALFHEADTPGRDHVWQQRWGVAGSLHWTPDSRLTVDADYYHASMKGMSDYGLPFDPRSQMPFAVDPDNFYGAVGRDFLNGSADAGTLTAKFAASDDLTLRSQTRYGAVTNRYVVSVPGRAPVTTAADPALWTVTTSATQRNAISRAVDSLADATWKFATGGIDHTLVAGVEYANERVTNRRYAFPAYVEDAAGNPVATATAITLNLYNPNPLLGYTIPAVADPATPDTVNRVETLSAYAIDTLHISEQWSLTGGLRHDSYTIRATGGAGAAAYDRTLKQDFLNWQASLTWKPAPAATLYVSVSTSSNPSGEQLDSTADSYGGLGAGTASLEPERNHAWEAGVKYELAGGWLMLSGAAFRTVKQNAREQVATNVWQLAGTLRSQGFELGVNGNVTSRLALFGGYTFLDATITDSAIVANVGQRFANVPRHSAALLATYALDKHLTLGGQATYRSEIRGGSYAAGTAHVPGYWRFDAVARYRLTDRFELRANVLNLTDKRYFDAIYRSATPYAYVAPGRSATFSLTAKF